jgi:hypothetical protein
MHSRNVHTPLKTIRLTLARNPGHPEGDLGHGYVFRAPLDEQGYFDRFRWAAAKSYCTVKRLEKGTEAESGLLVLNKRGVWVFSYAPGTEDDESLFRLAARRFAPGEYVSITEHDGVERTFRIAEVADWHPDPAAAIASVSKR